MPALLALQFRLADKLVFAKIRALLGGRVRRLTGAAPISYEILEFLWAIGLPILEAYGDDRSHGGDPHQPGSTARAWARWAPLCPASNAG